MSRDRDQILEQALEHELRSQPPPGDVHVDAEMLAAWTDGALDPATVTALETHVSSCRRCQQLVGAMARTVPAAEAGPTVGASTGRTAWWKWLVPITAAATAAVVWMVVPAQQRLAVAPPRPSPPPAETRERDNQPQEAPAPAPKSNAATDSLSARADRDAPLDAQADTKRKEQKLADGAAAAREQSRNMAALKSEQPAVADAAPLAAPTAPVSPAAAAAPAAAAPAQRQATFAERSAAESSLARAANLTVTSPDQRRRWRVTADSIERTDDGGSTWAMVHLLRGESLVAGTSPSSSVCWFVGSAGTVMITVDGAVFVHVDVPGRPNLTSVTARDAQAAEAATADGRRFGTADSGRTWREN